MNFNKFENVPNSILKDVTEKPAAANPTTNTSIPAAADKGSATVDDILKANINTKVSPLSLDTGQQQTAQQTISGLPQTGNMVSVGQMLEAKLAIELMDALLPGLFVAIFHAVDVKLRKSELQLTEKEKNTITPIFQACLNTIMLNFNSPWTTLAVTCGVIYGSKITEKGLVGWIDKLNEKKEFKALEEKTGLTVASVNKENVHQDLTNKYQPPKSNQQVLQELKKPYDEAEVRTIMKTKNYGRKRAMDWLDRKYGLVKIKNESKSTNQARQEFEL